MRAFPTGVLLYGPPGTGKTLLARAVAGEAGVPFFSISGSDFVEMFVGVGASRVRDLFEQAKQNSPCIIFMDEIDAVGRHRGAGLGGGHDEREQTLNQLLVEMDGFEAKDNIIMIAATNRPDILDPALLRPGRFDRQIAVDRPDRKGRAKILEVHTRGKPLSKEIDIDALAGQTPGFTGADLSNLINEAALLAARTGKREIGQEELEEGIMRVIAGPEKKTRVMSEKERLITAFHEMGHALVGHFLEHADPVHKVSVVSRGQALGYTISMPQEDRFLTTRAELEDAMAMTLGGRAAEELIFGEITTGASNDIEKVTATAKQMVMRFGMSDKLGPRVYGHEHNQPFLGREFSTEPDYSDDIAREIDDEVRRIIEARAPARADDPHRAPQRPHDHLRDPRQARDDREGGVRRPARRQERTGSLRRRQRRRRRHAARAAGAPDQARTRAASGAAPRPGRRHRRDALRRPRSPRARLSGAAAPSSLVSAAVGVQFTVMGIVNATPDSFSDGGEHADAAEAAAHGRRMLAEGAALIDVGGESTRPGAQPVALEEERRRVLPVVEALAVRGRDLGRHEQGGARERGSRRRRAHGQRRDGPARRRRDGRGARGLGCAPVPDAHAGRAPHDADRAALQRRRRRRARVPAKSASGSPSAPASPRSGSSLDPGIGFGKTVQHNLELLERLGELTQIGRPLLVGTSRKSFLGRLAARDGEDAPVRERLPGTIATNVLALERGASIFRVHDVGPVRDALTVAAATLGAR